MIFKLGIFPNLQTKEGLIMKTTCRKMSWVQLTFVTAANMLGAGIIMLPTQLAEVGTISIFSWIITSLGSLALAMTFSRCGMYTTKRGGMGGYAEYAFGRTGHFMANYAYAVYSYDEETLTIFLPAGHQPSLSCARWREFCSIRFIRLFTTGR